MSQENVELVRRGLVEFQTTGAVLWDTLSENVEIRDHDIPDREEYCGHEGFRRWLQDWGDAWSDWNLEVEELLDAGESVVVFVHVTATGAGSGVQVDRQDSIVYTIESGKIARIDYFNSREQGLRAAGPSGSTSSPGGR